MVYARRLCCLMILMLQAPLIHAENLPVPTPTTRDEALAQRERAEAMKSAAEKQLNDDNTACYDKILVSGCLKEAHKRYKKSMVEVREMDMPARIFLRQSDGKNIKARREKDAQERAQEALSHKKEVAQQREKDAIRKAEREERIAQRSKQAEEHHQKMAKEAAAREERRAKRAKREAEQAEKRAKEAQAANSP